MNNKHYCKDNDQEKLK